MIESAWNLFRLGGPIMWPILIASVFSLGVAIERFVALRRSRILPDGTVRQVLRLVREGKIAEAKEVCVHDGGPFAVIARSGLEWWGHGFEAVREAVEDAGRRETPALMRGLGAIGTVASVTPLLGLLGTATGMIKVFRTISLVGAGQGQELSEGIAQALLTTAFGLTVAIPSLVLHNVLASKAERLVLDIESACHDIIRESQTGVAADLTPREKGGGERVRASSSAAGS